MSRIRRTQTLVLPSRRALTALQTHFDPREMYVPENDAACVDLIRRAEARLERGAAAGGGVDVGEGAEHLRVGDLVAAAMGPDEATCVRAIELLGRVPERALRAFEGELFALIQVHLLRREPRRALFVPPVEALIRTLPFWPERVAFSYGVPNAPTLSWVKEARTFVETADSLDDPAYPILLQLSERFERLHHRAMSRLVEGPAPDPAAAAHIARAYEAAVIPLVRHPVEAVAAEVRKVATAWLEPIEVPDNEIELADFGDDTKLESRHGATQAGLLRVVVDEHRPDLVTEQLGLRALEVVLRLYEASDLDALDPASRGHVFLILAALCAPHDRVSAELLEELVDVVSQPSAPARALAHILDHPAVDEPLLERLLARILETGGRIIDQSKRLSHPLFPHHRPAFRRAMIEGYRRTIGAPWLVQAVFMATPPEDLHESLRFLMTNHARSLPRLVRRWIDANPGGTGRTRIPRSMIHQLKLDSNAGMSVAGVLLEEYQDAVPAGAESRSTFGRTPRGVEDSSELLWDL